MKTRIVYYENTGRGTGSSQSLRAILALIDRDRFEPVLWFGDRGNQSLWSGEKVVESQVGWLSNCDYFSASWRLKWLKHFIGFVLKSIRDVFVVPHRLAVLKPDVLHINSGQGVIVGLAAWRLGIPVVWHIREFICKNLLGSIQDLIYARASSRIVAISHAVQERLPRSAASGKMSVMYNAVGRLARPTDQELDHFRRTLRIPSGVLVVLLLGHVCLAKGYAFLADVADLVVDDDIFFILAGNASGEMKKEVEMVRSRWNVHEQSGRALFCGRVEAAQAISVSDVVVCPNLVDEPLGRTVLESYRLGVPVIAMDRPAFDETVLGGHTGWLLPPETHAWAELLKDLATHPHVIADRYAEIEAFKTRFDDQQYVNDLQEMYQDLSCDH